MTLSKIKGYRPITVNGQHFKWLFVGTITVVPDGDDRHAVLNVDFGWFDHWLYVNNRTASPPEFEPRQVTPSFVASAIIFALEHGWSTAKRGEKYMLTYRADVGFRTRHA